MFDFTDKIAFRKAVYYSINPIPLYRPFQDGSGGNGKYAPERGFMDLYDDEGCCAHHLAIGRSFVERMLPRLLNGEKKSYNQWREDLYWQIRNAGFQSEQAVEVGQVDLMMLDLLAQRHGKSLHRFMGAEKDWAVCYKGGGSILCIRRIQNCEVQGWNKPGQEHGTGHHPSGKGERSGGR